MTDDRRDSDGGADVRPYRHPGEFAALWSLKAAFERELGAAGGADKRDTYEGKLTDEYRARYREWVGRCLDEEPECVLVADAAGDDPGSRGDGSGTGSLSGYAFLLPASLSMVWDAAVLNEIYVRDAHRGTGVADDLLAGVLARAREQDLPLDRIVLDVDAENERARGFYRRHGFTHWGEMVAREL